MRRVVVVGASVGGVTVVQTLRELGFDGAIVVVETSPGLPYQRPPLSKDVLLGADPACADLVDEPTLRSWGVDLVEARATAIDVAARRLQVDRTALRYDELVVASGAAADVPGRLRSLLDDGAHVLRTRDDAAAVATAFRRHGEITVVGGGVLGSEIASAARARGLRTTLLARPRPSLGPLRGELADPLHALHREHGVLVETGAREPERTGDGWLLAHGGRPVPADAVVVAVGVRAHARWLLGSLPVGHDGVRCDPSGQAAPHVWAVGDVADWAGSADDVSRRTQAAAVSQARVVAGAVAGVPTTAAQPYFWSDLHGVKVQAVGRIPADSSIVPIEPGADRSRSTFAVLDRAGTIVGAAAWGDPRGLRRVRALLGRPRDELGPRPATTPLEAVR